MDYRLISYDIQIFCKTLCFVTFSMKNQNNKDFCQKKECLHEKFEILYEINLIS